MSHWPHRPALVQPGKDHTALGVTKGSLGRTTLPWGSPEGPWGGPHCPGGGHRGSLGRTTLPRGPPGVLVGLHSAEVNGQQGTEVAGADTCGSSSRACTSCLITPAWWSLGSWGRGCSLDAVSWGAPSGPPWSCPPPLAAPWVAQAPLRPWAHGEPGLLPEFCLHNHPPSLHQEGTCEPR